MAEVLTWIMQRRRLLEERVEQLRKELGEIDTEVAQLEAAEVVIGQFIEAEQSSQADAPALHAEFEDVTTAPCVRGMRLVPHRADGMDRSVLPEHYQEIIRVVAGAAEPVKAGVVSVKLGKGALPGQAEAVRAKLKRLAERGWLHRTPAGLYYVPTSGEAAAGP